MGGANDGHVAAVISRSLFLLVGRVVLFVHDDETEAGERGKHRGAGTDHDVNVSASDAVPLIVTLAVGEGAVLNRHPLAERPAEERGD